MADLTRLDRAHQLMMQAFVERGSALHYTELAGAFGIAPEEGKALLHDLMNAGLPAWLYDGTDYVASYAPFNNVPTQYRISVEGRPRAYGQWGFESLAVCWLFPGQEITIDAPCLDCGEPLRVVVRDGRIVSADPPTIHSFVDVPFRNWRPDLAHSWSRMNLFRSEEHVRNWSGYTPQAEEGLLTLAQILEIFSAEMFRARGAPDYLSRYAELRPAFIRTLGEVTAGRPFWQLPKWHRAAARVPMDRQCHAPTRW